MTTAATIPVNVYEGQDFYVPAFLIKVQAREIRAEMNDVISLTYSDSLTNIDSFDMVVNNWDAGAEAFDQRALKYSDKETFNPWRDVEVWMGYFRNGQDERHRMLIGEITTMTPHFPQSSAPTLTVRGLNLLHRFRTKPETKPFFNKKDTEIAQILGGTSEAARRAAADGIKNLRKNYPGGVPS